VIVEAENGVTAYFSQIATYHIDNENDIDLGELEIHFKSFEFGTDKTYINLYNIQFIEENKTSSAQTETIETILNFYNGHQYRIPMAFKNFSQLFNQR
jgi:hypothetical protein